MRNLFPHLCKLHKCRHLHSKKPSSISYRNFPIIDIAKDSICEACAHPSDHIPIVITARGFSFGSALLFNCFYSIEVPFGNLLKFTSTPQGDERTYPKLFCHAAYANIWRCTDMTPCI